jgi:hypothetical protein
LRVRHRRRAPGGAQHRGKRRAAADIPAGAPTIAIAPELADAVVPVADLSLVLSTSFAEPNPRILDAAWRRLGREAAKSGGRRAAHEAYARRRWEAFRLRRQA